MLLNQKNKNIVAILISLFLFIIFQTEARGASSESATGGVYSNPQAVTVNHIGSASFSYPIAVPPGRNGLQPNISLQYSSYNENGWLGVGWDLNLGSISRSTRKGVDYTDDEYMADGSDLVPRSDWGTNYYGAKIEGAFTKYQFLSSSNSWIATAKDGTKYFYGSTSNSRMTNANGTYSWQLSRVEDTNGNFMTISYTDTTNNNQIYPYQISYTGYTDGYTDVLTPTKIVEFGLEDRDDIITSYKTKSLVTTAKRLETITVTTGSTTAYKYILDYENSGPNGRSRLAQIKQVDPDDEDEFLPPYDFTYFDGGDGTFITADTQTLNGPTGGAPIRNNYLRFGDLNGDGRQDFIKCYSPDVGIGVNRSTVTIYPYLANGTGFTAQVSMTLEDCQAAYSGETMMSISLGDVDGDGDADILSNGRNGNVHVYLSNGNGTFSSTVYTTNGSSDCGGAFLTEINGDGKADLVKFKSTGELFVSISNGNGYFGTQVTSVVAGSGAYYLYAATPHFADFNGDGNTDVLVCTEFLELPNRKGIELTTWIGDGNGSFSVGNIVFYNSVPQDDFHYIWYGNEMTCDANGDGLADIAYFTSSNGLMVHLSTGTGITGAIPTTTQWAYDASFADINDDGMDDLVLSGYFHSSNGDGTYSTSPTATLLTGKPLLADIDGDGRPDYIIYTPSASIIAYALSDGENAGDNLETIFNSFGGKTNLTYGNSSEFPNNRIPFILHPVTLIEAYDDINASTPAETTSYDYSDAYYDYDERDSRGFGYVKQTNADGSTVEKTYEQLDNYKKGKPLLIEMKEQGQSTPFQETINTWGTYAIPNTSAEFVKLNSKITTYDDNNNYLSAESYLYYNNNGFLQKIIKSGKDANGNTVEQISDSSVYQNFDTWTWRLTEETVTGTATGLARKMTYDYDSNGNMTDKIFWRTASNDYDPIVYGHDDYGNVTSETDGEGNTTTIVYETNSDYTYPHTITNAKSHVITKTWDYRFGKEDLVTDPNSNKTDYEYDAYGRVINITNKDALNNIVAYSETDYTNYDQTAFPRYITTRTLESGSIASGVYIEKEDYFDGLNRSIKTITDGIDDFGSSTQILSSTVYDNMGRKDIVYGPYFDGEAENSRYYEDTYYDARGRVSSIISPDEDYNTISIVYTYPNPFTTEITDPDGKQKTEKRDHLGRIIEVIEHAGDDVANPVLKTTSYWYNAAGDMTEVENALGISTLITYDARGLKLTMDDPDMGAWSYTYDENGNLETQTDAKNNVITFSYDELNRVYDKIYTIPASKPQNTQDVQYRYDGYGLLSCTNCIGQLTSIDNSDVYIKYDEFDEMGRVKNVTKTITGDQARTTHTEYDLSGKVTFITHPDSFTVNNIYYPGTNLLDSVTGTPQGGNSTEYAKCTWYEPTGKIRRIYHDYNGTDTVYTYGSHSTRLEELQTYSGSTVNYSGTNTIQDRSYVYSRAGDIEEITDYKEGITYTYTYDNLHRLLDEASTDTSAPTSAEVLIYNYNNVDHINAVSSINYNGNNYNYTYDANGNMLTGPDFTNSSSVVTRTIQWNADNMPKQITHSVNGITYLTYDGDGARAKKVAGGTTTYYISSDYEIKNGTHIKYIFAGNLRVAEIEGSTATIFHKDHLGSSTAMTNSTAGEIETSEYMPFGGMREHTGTEVSDYKFTDQELDNSSNLYNYDARLYDPVIGRFLSADTVVPEWNNPQSLNRYSYCINNPLIYTDPSGHLFWEGLGEFFSWITGNTKKKYGDGDPYNQEKQKEPEKPLLYQFFENRYGPEDEVDWGYELTKEISEHPVDIALLPFVMGEFLPTTSKGVNLSGRTSKSVSLFRSVETAELADIEAIGGFRNIAGIEVKYFSTNAEGAAREAKLLSKMPGIGPFTIVETSIDKGVLRALPKGNALTVDGGVSTIVIPTDTLPTLQKPKILSSMPIPKE